MRRFAPALIAAVLAGVSGACAAAEGSVAAPQPRVDAPGVGRGLQTAIFAGGCFWGVEGVFSRVNGVVRAESGYAGPGRSRVNYESVGSGDTGFAEAVRVTYDPARVSYGTLMRVFFSVVADPTTRDYQGPDHGSQYRSALFPLNAGQDRAARAYLAQLGKSGLWRAPIVTRVESLGSFQPAEAYHQDFLARNPRHGYIVQWDAPKLAALKTRYPQLWSAKTAR